MASGQHLIIERILRDRAVHRGAEGRRRRGVMASAAGVVLAGVVVLAGAGPASAAGPVRVDCATADLQDAIDNAPSGTALIVTGSCTGDFIPFTINKNLSLIGRDTAELNGGLVITGDVTVNLTSLTITGNFGSGLSNSEIGISNESGTVWRCVRGLYLY